MKMSFETKGSFDNTERWLKQAASANPTDILNRIAEDGKKSLSSNTPKETGETASGWTSKVTTKGSVSEVAWSNNAHPESEANVAVLIDKGHGTRTGGYVPPRPYIEKAMDPVFNNVGDKIAKELIK